LEIGKTDKSNTLQNGISDLWELQVAHAQPHGVQAGNNRLEIIWHMVLKDIKRFIFHTGRGHILVENESLPPSRKW
jgi:hypothetical protein